MQVGPGVSDAWEFVWYGARVLLADALASRGKLHQAEVDYRLRHVRLDPVFWSVQRPPDAEDRAGNGLSRPGRCRLAQADAELGPVLRRHGNFERGGEIGRASCRERVCQYV